MIILGIDPGTYCGWALRDGGRNPVTMDSGVWNLKPNRYEGGGMRWVRLRQLLRPLLRDGVQLVVYEEVRRHMGVDAAHIYGGVIGVLQEECEDMWIPYTAIPVGTIKKFATGKGNAKKPDMDDAGKRKWPNHVPEDDNETDARWIAECAASQHT